MHCAHTYCINQIYNPRNPFQVLFWFQICFQFTTNLPTFCSYQVKEGHMNSFIFSFAWILKYFRTVIILYAFKGGTSQCKKSVVGGQWSNMRLERIFNYRP